MYGNLFSMPDGRIGTVSDPSNNPFTVRLYEVSSNGLNFTWSEDISISSSWSTDNHGFACDGRFLVLISRSNGHRVYDLETGTQYSQDSWNLQPSGIGNPTQIAHDHINNRYIIGDHEDNDFVIYNDAIYDYEVGIGNFTSYPINTTYNITKISNITWQESGADSDNNISVEISLDNGQNWYSAENGQGISSIQTGNSLVYKVIYRRVYCYVRRRLGWSNIICPCYVHM
jgi:hypothetical protein